MAIIDDESVFDDVYELSVDDPVLGGDGGASNHPIQNLANRTRWLKDAIDALESGGGPFDYNASGGLVPTHTTNTPGGSGVAGAILRKDQFVVTVAGTVGGNPLQVGDSLIAKQDAPTLITHYVIIQGNATLATDTVLGLVKLAQDISGGAEVDKVLSIAGLINLFAQLNSPTLTGSPKAPTKAQTDISDNIATTSYVATRVSDAIAAEVISRINADGILQGNINTEASTRLGADNAEAGTRAAADAAEVIARGAADTVLQNNITAEAAARTAADATLQGNINAINENNVPWVSVATAGITLEPGWVVIGNNLEIRKLRGMVQLRGNIRKTSGPAPTSAGLVLTLPVAYRPIIGAAFVGVSKNLASGYLMIEINNTGGVNIYEQNKAGGAALTDTAVCFDGVQFDMVH
jgi:hypothetical protein